MFLIQVSQGGAVLFAPPRKAVAFLTTRSVCQKHGTGISLPAACFRNTTRIRFGKAGAHPQLALGIAIAPETLSHIYNLSILKAIAILPIFSQIFVVFHCAVLLFASQMWAARPHLGSIFEKLLHRKTF